MIEFLMAGALLTAPVQSQDPADPPAPVAGQPITLEDVTVTGRPLDALIRNFVAEVAEPNRRRGLARWNDRICVGVANLRPEAAQYLVDRVSTIAEDVGLEAGEPGCTPNILVIATADAESMARSLVQDRLRAFRKGGAGMDRGAAALNDFVETPRPVRWWQMAMPVDSDTGMRAVRLPGECSGSCSDPNNSVFDYAPMIDVFAASRLRTQIVDNLIRAIVIVDVDEVSQFSITQLADYIAMVSLAQIDPEADTSAYASILNVMADPGAADGLMDWDRAYLAGLYDAERNDANRRAQRSEISRSIHAAHREIRDDRQTDRGGEGVSH